MPTAAPAPGRLARLWPRALCAGRLAIQLAGRDGVRPGRSRRRQSRGGGAGLHGLGRSHGVHRRQGAGHESRMDGPLPRRRPAGAAPHAGDGARARALRAGRRAGGHRHARSSAATRSCTSRCAPSRRRARRPTTACSSWPTSRTTPRRPRWTTPRACAGCNATCLPNVPVAWGAARDHRSDDMAGGTYVVAHVARGGNRWDRVSRVQELGDLSRRTGKFVVDSEPIGAAESPQPSTA